MISLFVRSCPADFSWLDYSIMSMRKNLTGIDESVLVLPYNSSPPQAAVEFFDKIIHVHEKHNGYIQQQVDKVSAYKFCDGEFILFSDSDCIYYSPFDAAKDRFSDGRILLPKTSYASGALGQAIAWQAITYSATGIMPDYEYMRCFPIMHHRDVLKHLDNSGYYNNYLSVVKDKSLSEFNAIGVIAEKHYSHIYSFLDTLDGEYENRKVKTAKQYWSWGGMNHEVLSELNAI